MFACHACMQRYVRALTDSIGADSFHYGPRLARRRAPSRRCYLSNTAVTRNDAAAAFVQRERSGVPPKSWRNLNKDAEGDEVVTWRDAPRYTAVQRARAEFAEKERSEKERSEKGRAEEKLAENERTKKEARELLFRKRHDNEPQSWWDSPEFKSQSKRREHALKNQPKDGSRPPDWIPREKRSRRLGQGTLLTELKYLHDPVKLADHVRYTLEQDDHEKAVALVRMSSKKAANTVSWNHLIDWEMKRGKTTHAIQTYNEMKKRGQKPDSYTYLMLLRGLADWAHHPHTLGRALSIYHAMRVGANSIAPNIIHTNAMLKVCSRANDLDSMWDIASQLPESGPHAANNLTYTIIFNTMRTHALTGGPHNENPEAMARRREETIVDARRLWGPLVARWRKGDLLIDEGVVCALGRLLLIGQRPRDWDDILSLVQQTMNIARLVPRLGTAARQESSVPRVRAPKTPDDMKNDAAEIVDPYGDARPGDEFNDVAFDNPRTVTVGQSNSSRAQSRNAKAGPGGYALPGNATISLIMESCLKMAAKQPARNYWDLLTDPQGHAVTPDLNNVEMFLRVLRQARAAGEAVGVVCDDMPRLQLAPTAKTFRIGMSACSRDGRNPNVLGHAARLLDAMPPALGDPDMATVHIYAELVRDQETLETLQVGILRLEPVITNIRSLLTFGAPDRLSDPQREFAVLSIQMLIGCYDKLLRLDSEIKEQGGGAVTAGLPANIRSRMISRKASQAAFVTRLHEKEAKRAKEVDVDKSMMGEGDRDRRSATVSAVAAETARLRAEAAVEQKARFAQR